MLVVFLNSPCRGTSEDVLKKKQARKKKSDGGWVSLGFSKRTGDGGVRRFFFGRPLVWGFGLWGQAGAST
jgi:hypothetical protein